MSIQIVPYNNAMRLGQGFNSYTQQICIDDAVVVDPERAENVITNDGTTMRIMVEKSAAPSVWNRQPEVVTDRRAAATLRLQKPGHVVDEDEASAAESPPDKDEEVNTGSVEIENANDLTTPADGVTLEDPTTHEPPAAKGEASADAETEKSDSIDHITEDDLHEKTSEPAVDDGPEGAATSSEQAVRGEAPDRVKTAGNVVPKSLPSSLKAVAGFRSAAKPSNTDGTSMSPNVSTPAASRTSKNQAALQRATSKVKADAARKKDEERLQKEAQKQEDEVRRKREEKRIQDQRDYEEEIEKEARADERIRRQEERKEQQAIRSEQRAFETKRREDARKAIEAAANLKATSLEDLKKIAAQNEFAARFTGILENTQQYAFDASGSRGPSQTVTYTSRFVDRLSDVTDDMCISGSLSIKAGKIGGSGKGSFVDSDKFKESDLNFYISVKVVNQTINFKDALVYNPLRSVTKENFQQIFGDSFISGFVEGGEFNALVSMKILNKAKKTDIQAEAKVALTAGPVNIEAEANVGIARSNLETNTETTIQVSWSGGGHIKPMEQQWDVASLMEAAARFPDLVADCPQRTYAIVTKYETLRSFLDLKPAGCTPLQYENAQIYTNALLDSFMSYKSLYKQLGEHIFCVKGKTLEILSWPDGEGQNSKNDLEKRGEKDKRTGLYPYSEDLTRFEATIKGLSDARVAIRRQMARIVNEVDLVEKDPKLATDEDHKEPFQSPVAFETRIPTVDVPERLKRRTHPLSGRIIKARELTEAEQKAELKEDEELQNAPALYSGGSQLSTEETTALDGISNERPGIGRDFRVTQAAGSETEGKSFNNLDIIRADWAVKSIVFHVYRGSISYVGTTYENGLLIGKGVMHNDAKSLTVGPLSPGERFISSSIETGVRSNDPSKSSRVLAVGLFTNRGRSFLAAAPTEARGDGIYSKDDVNYEGVEVIHVDGPIENGTLKGLFGRSDDDPNNEGIIWRFGLIWGRSSGPVATDKEAKPLGLGSMTSIAAASSSSQGGIYGPTSWNNEQADCINRGEIKFSPVFSKAPLMISGINVLDGKAQKSVHADVRHALVASDGAASVIRTIQSCMWAVNMSWLAIPQTDKHIETGVYEFLGDETSDGTDWISKTITIPFSRPFSKPPNSTAWLCQADSSGDSLYSCWALTDSSTVNSLKCIIRKKSPSGNNFGGIRVGWFAYDPNECPNIQHGIITKDPGKARSIGRMKFSRDFGTTPSIFLATSAFHAGSSKNLRVRGNYSGVRQDGFDYDCGCWVEGDHDLKEFAYAWIAVA